MSDLRCQLRRHRARAGFSQQALAQAVGVSRQALIAIEAGRQIPSTRLSLLLARALRCRVEELFALPEPALLTARLPEGAAEGRVVMGRVDGQWVAHPLASDAVCSADGILLSSGRVQPLGEVTEAGDAVLIAGCAPLLGLFSGRHPDVRVRWLAASSGRALDLLDAGLVHVAGLHFFDAATDEANRRAIQQRFAGRAMAVVNLVCWRQGLLIAPGNPLGISGVAGLAQPRLRFARRAPDAGASKLIRSLLGAHTLPKGPLAAGHLDVARLIRAGAADAGVAIEAAALSAGLGFQPLSEERFDLVFPAELADDPMLQRVLDVLGSWSFRTEASHIPGYDLSLSGTMEAA